MAIHTTRRALPLLAAASLFVLAGCSTPQQGGSTEAGTDIIVGYGDVDSLDPIQFKAPTGYAVLANIYGTLFNQEYEEVDGYLRGVEKYVPAIADSAEYNEDGTLLTITIKPDLKFSDGDDLTASDVVYTLQRSLSDAGYTGVFGTYLNIADPSTGISAVDDTTVEIVTTGVSPVLEKFLSFQTFGILSEDAALENSQEEWATDYFATNSVASGPYEVSEWTPGQSIILTKNPEYTITDMSSAPETVTLQNMPSPEQAFLALQNESIDVSFGLPPALASEAQSTEGVTVYGTESSDLVYMGMNLGYAPLQDVRVRQAISYLIPTDALREQVMEGFAGTAYGPVPYPMIGALDDDGTQVAYGTDVDKAAALLEAAGAEGLSLKLSTTSSDPTMVEAATFIQSALGEAGIEITVDQMTDAAYNTALSDGTMQLFLGSWYSWGEDAVYQMNFLLKSDAFTNYARFDNPEFDALLAEAMLQPTAESRAELAQAAQQIALDEAPWAYLYTRDQVIVAAEGLTGLTRPDDQFPRFEYLTFED
ncbi:MULTISPECIES: ABC transporter substrate-binding protein [unclassified Microbacterium]|uniref:ABC transporter substrate-binding protein n=1 Tax=unclassified Microbacterium TaxID=2609290 RepID=UPI00214CAD6B|nr:MULTISPECIES: ABC transporter substrate-binding protein [unclassified Microbacterium]MCR2810632.1 ABC transporter substrate-binding protein [Microbacterium sp. zg.B185]WIM18169.1 ABC transporter substrate-binding protein [Microbacterium sp. zg-B185]